MALGAQMLDERGAHQARGAGDENVDRTCSSGLAL